MLRDLIRRHTFDNVREEHWGQVGYDAGRRVQPGNGVDLDQVRDKVFSYHEIGSEQLKRFRAVKRIVRCGLNHCVNALAHPGKYQFVPNMFLTDRSEKK